MLTIMLIIMLIYAYYYAFMLILCFYAIMLAACYYALFYARIIGTSQVLGRADLTSLGVDATMRAPRCPSRFTTLHVGWVGICK